MKDVSGIHRRTPTLMVFVLLLGITFALSHDQFYHVLEGSRVRGDSYTLAGSRISRQQLNIAVGTAFAFLVKSALVSSVSLAYEQIVWRAARNERRPITVANMDTLFSALGNMLALLDVDVWRKWPLLPSVALISWLIPVASILTPATLSFGVRISPPQMLEVPQVAFESLNLVAPMHIIPTSGSRTTCRPGPGNSTEASFERYDTADANADALDAGCTHYAQFGYAGPSFGVSKAAFATAVQGDILTVPAPASNSSWSLKFPGPSLRCRDIEGDLKRFYEESIANFIFSNCDAAPGYLAWTPITSLNSTDRENLPFQRPPNGSYWFNTASPTDRKHGTLATLFVAATVPTMRLKGREGELKVSRSSCDIVKSSWTYEQKLSALFNESSTFLRCDVYNSTYHTDFEFLDGRQRVNVRTTNLSREPVAAVANVWGLLSHSVPDTHCPLLVEDTPDGVNCGFNASTLTRLSYQATMDAFAELVKGKVSMTWSDSNYGYRFDSNTSISGTVLTAARELDFFHNWPDLMINRWAILQDVQPGQSTSPYQGLTNVTPTGREVSLKDALEELFRNITVSMMSSPSLQPNKSSAFYPPKTEVTSFTHQPIYVYSRDRLWIAYGVAISLATFVVALGLLMTRLNQASFSSTFSTLLRVCKGAELSVGLEKADLVGKDPLPERLGKATITFAVGSRADNEESLVVFESVPVRSKVMDGR